MKTRTTREMKRALLAKGFQQRNSHHEQFILHINGRKTRIKTFLSHGAKEYGKELMNKVRDQMNLTGKETDDFFDCTMTGADYARLMQERGP